MVNEATCCSFTVLCFGSTRICLHVFDIQNLFFLDFPKIILSVESFKHSSSDICSSLWLMSDVWLSCGAEKWFDDTGTTYTLLFRSSFFPLILLRTWKFINIRTKTIKWNSQHPKGFAASVLLPDTPVHPQRSMCLFPDFLCIITAIILQ